jgi:hypothetical protein
MEKATQKLLVEIKTCTDCCAINYEMDNKIKNIYSKNAH